MATTFAAKGVTVARFVMGAVFLVFGLNGFFNFIPMPPMPERAGAFLGALAMSGYMFPLIKMSEIVVGVALLANRFVPLALIVISPVLVNIVAFHLFLAPAGLAMPIVLSVLQLYLAWSYRDAFVSVLRVKHEPTHAKTAVLPAQAGSAA